TGSLSITQAANLRTLDGLDALTAIDQGVVIGTDCLSIGCSSNAVLENIDALANVGTATPIVVSGNQALRDLSAFRGVTSAVLRIESNPALARISGLTALTSG